MSWNALTHELFLLIVLHHVTTSVCLIGQCLLEGTGNPPSGWPLIDCLWKTYSYHIFPFISSLLLKSKQLDIMEPLHFLLDKNKTEFSHSLSTSSCWEFCFGKPLPESINKISGLTVRSKPNNGYYKYTL